MPQTKLNLDQSTWIGGSGTFVADEELTAVSGTLVNKINTGDQEIRTELGDLIQNLNLESGYFDDAFNFAWQELSLHGDANDGTPLDLYGFPTIRLNKNAIQSIAWNLRAPVGGASGINLQFAWTPGATAAGIVKFRLQFAQYTSGAMLNTTTKDVYYLNLTKIPHVGTQWTKDKIYINTITMKRFLPNLAHFNLRLLFDGPGSTFTSNVHIIGNSVNFYVD